MTVPIKAKQLMILNTQVTRITHYEHEEQNTNN